MPTKPVTTWKATPEDSRDRKENGNAANEGEKEGEKEDPGVAWT
jgi:hypothetical protein